jgi:hypothetical protein
MNILDTLKNALGSKTIWGILIALIPTVLAKFGLQITDVAAFAAGSEQTVNDVTALIGSVLAIYGRAKATGSLIVKKSP